MNNFEKIACHRQKPSFNQRDKWEISNEKSMPVKWNDVEKHKRLIRMPKSISGAHNHFPIVAYELAFTQYLIKINQYHDLIYFVCSQIIWLNSEPRSG